MIPKVVHIDADPAAAMTHERAALAEVGLDLTACGCPEDADTAQIAGFAHDADVIITDHLPMSRAVIEQCPRVLAIIRTGTGFDSVDVEAATEHGIIVINFPDYSMHEVANHTLMFLLACAKRLIHFDQRLREGYYPDKYDRDAGLVSNINTIYDESLGIVGLGRIGRQVARRAQAFGMQVCACDPYIASSVFHEYQVRPVTLQQILTDSDYVSLHTPLTNETRNMIRAEQLALMKPTAHLVNTSRGKVVNLNDLVHALQTGQIAGAALDVFEDEPLPADSPLLVMPNVVLSPHIAGRSDVAFDVRLPQQIGSEAARVATLQFPRTIVNPQVKGHSRLEQRQNDSNG